MQGKIENKFNRYLRNLLTEVDVFLKNSENGSEIGIWPQFSVNLKQDDIYELKLTEPLLLSQMPYWPRKNKNKNNNKRNLQIFIDGIIEIKICNKNTYELYKYGTRISYCKTVLNNEMLEPMDGYHYDMVTESELAHPIFHVQRNPEIINKVLKNTSFKVDENKINLEQFILNNRIATPQYDFLSLIPMVLADHGLTKNNDNLDSFMRIIKQTTEEHPACVNLIDRGTIKDCFKNQSLINGYWYN